MQERFIDTVHARLDAVLTASAKSEGGVEPGRVLWSAAQHTCLSGAAKRARPRLVNLFAMTIALDDDRALDVALAAELIHAASLMHDDVIDEGTVRRGKPTVNAHWDNLTAVLSGDLLFSLAFHQLKRCPTAVMLSAIEVVKEMTCAAIEEAQCRGNLELGIPMWERIATGKTGALFGWCGRAPALIAGSDDAAARFDSCGRLLGVAFQLADDLKDFLVDDGKDRFADLLNQNPSYPILWASAHVPELREEIGRAWTNSGGVEADQAREIGQRIVGSAAIEASLITLRNTVEAGVDALGPSLDTAAGQEIAHWARVLSKVGEN